MTEQDQFFNLLVATDRQKANGLAERWAREHGYDSAIEMLLEPALTRLGELWDDQEISLAQGYMAAKIAGDLLGSAAGAQTRDAAPRKKRGPVVLGNIEDDFHALGRRLVATFLTAAGWEVHDLGNDVVPRDFVDQALKVGAKVIGASAMMASTAINIGHLRAELDGRGLTGKIQLAVGGAIFRLRPELVEEVGGDGTTGNALGAPALFETLWNEAEET